MLRRIVVSVEDFWIWHVLTQSGINFLKASGNFTTFVSQENRNNLRLIANETYEYLSSEKLDMLIERKVCRSYGSFVLR